MSLCEHADRALSIETLYPEHRTDKIGGKWSIAVVQGEDLLPVERS